MDYSNSVVHQRILITVKTYPTLSDSYGELVCTAGLREDGSWIRIYPIPFRLQVKEAQYKKYQWIELDVRKRGQAEDYRKESYSPVNLDGIKLGEFLEPDDPQRHEIIHRSRIYESLSNLTEGNKRERVSLATFKPTYVDDMIAEPCDREWNQTKLEKALQTLRQGTLFDSESIREFKRFFKPAKKIPYRFKYVFKDIDGRKTKLMVEDWEIGALFLKCLKQYDEKIAVEKTIEKYRSFISNPSLLFFLGTSKEFHHMSDNPFMIIGVYHESTKMRKKLSQSQFQPTLFF